MNFESGPSYNNSRENLEWHSEDKMEILKEKDIVAFDVDKTPEEQRILSEVSIETAPPQFDYYGPIDEELVTELTNYLQNIGENSAETINTISRFVARIADRTTKDFDKESAWVMVRVSLPNKHFDVPRWHSDGRYFDPVHSNDDSYKLVMTIKGSPTRFGEVLEQQKFHQLEIESSKNYTFNSNNPEAFEKEDMRIRLEQASVIQEIYPAKEGEAVYYRVGDEKAKIHSEPKINSPRIFMSVVPGSRDQVNELKERWKES